MTSFFVDTLEQDLLNHVFTDPAYTPPATWYIGLSSTTPTRSGSNFTEPSGGSYARVSTTAADWGAASGSNPAVKSNTAAKTFPTATADWVSAANLTWFGLFDASSGGNLKVAGTLTTAKPVLNGDTPSYAIGALVIKAGANGDSGL